MEHVNELAKRYSICYDRYGRSYRCNSAWNSWARWVVLGVIIFAALFLFFCCSCFSARRRRKAGRTPFYGTGWAGGNHGQAQYNPNYQTQQPAYGGQQQGYNQGGYGGNAPPQYGQAADYYGGNRDVEMQTPATTHGNDMGFAPPAGPPPGKH